ncbi:MAG: heme-binding domain-containing protein [Saprospiraceae bacterium]|nr:heme-binding domain-containing protein [Saprospiraceae bacterium]MBK7220204.1 heme-binding domain-containing protein [Saprospiraceae bacterium]MBK7787406.1 heme-binding domain-containing protein [Saprospiraceae bacterium]MBK8109783.1 heme-binding domain-containing protein [Saprospiraceae bacterium]MBK8849289.1 heme-binding domain-containing protein [Saprospiraceae bacterium]
MKKIATIVIVLLIVIQFFKPERNLSDDQSHHISTKYDFPEEIAAISKAACDDCHSNKTTYPWYANVQPAAWWLSQHVNDGKKHLNFSEFTKRRIAVQNHKLEEIVEMVEEGEMPLKSYTWLGLHPDAKLTQDQRSQLISWAKAQMDTIKTHYPADSLILKR